MIKIEEIENSNFIKNLSIDELNILSSEMREFILQSVSKTGGHLSSNLGIVDLTIAILRVFNAEEDIILFDVGHEAYPYKILTGRASGFKNLRKLGGMCGFQSKSESKYDHYETGHSSTSISTGLGFALARDLDNKKQNIITVIGDGAFGGGLAYEAINQLGDIKTKQIIILNDNQMSISENVGALHNFLDSIRSNKNYNEAKKSTKNILKKTKLGSFLSKRIHITKNNLKKVYLKTGSMFNDLGIEYYGPINGHDYNELLKYLEIAKNEDKPVILHVITAKGKGYAPAEEDKIGKYHGVGPFDLETGEVKVKTLVPSYSEIISSYVYNYAKKDSSIVCITPGMCYGSKLEVIKEKLPKQYLDTGIAEEHALLMANGLALAGKKPIVFIYSTFLQRAYDQLVHDIARTQSNVTLCVDRAGFVSSDGASHQGLFDIPMLLPIPQMHITQPKDAKEANNLIYTALNTEGPFVIRYPKSNIKYDYSKAQKLKIGSWEVLKEGNDAVIITYGDFTSRALNASEKLAKNSINVQVVNARFLKPFDTIMFEKIIQKFDNIFVYEESMTQGSLGSMLASLYPSAHITIIGVPDEFIPHGSREELIKKYHLDEDSLVNIIKKSLK